MKKFIMSCFLLVAVLISPGTHAEVTVENMTKALQPNRLKHPYLLFSEKEKPALLERIERDAESRDIYTRLLAEGNRLMYTPVEDAPVMDKNPRFTGDWSYNRFMFTNVENARTLAFLYQMTGDEAYAQKAFEFADAVCDLQTWTDRAHQFPIIYSRVMPWNVPDDQVMFSYDIYAAHIATDLATVYDWLYPALDSRQRDRIRGALLEKAVLRVRGNWDYHWWAWAYRCNWLTTCASGAGIASLALLTEDPQLVDVIAESFNRIWRTYDEIGVDGGWQEGVGYSAANHSWAVLYGDPLKRLTNGKYTLLNHPNMRDPVSFYLYTLFAPEYTANFGDAGKGLIRKTNIQFAFNKLADETGSDETVWYRNLLNDGEGVYDLIWPRSSVVPKEPTPKSVHFRSIDWSIMRSDFSDPDKVAIACKSGKNNDPHHGHLDIGSIILRWRGQAFIRDIGSVPYDQRCFDDARWDYIEASSRGHNVVFVNGELQIPGKWRGKPMDESIGGQILDFRTSHDRDYTLMESSRAYPMRELKGWRRHVTLEKPSITVILDEVTSARGAEIEARFFSEAAQRFRDTYVLLEGDRGTMAVIPVLAGKYTLRPGKLMNLPVQKRANLKVEPYFGIVVESVASTSQSHRPDGAEESVTVIPTIILPVDNDAEARAVAESASLDANRRFDTVSLAFSWKGGDYSYTFTREGDGLVLEK